MTKIIPFALINVCIFYQPLILSFGTYVNSDIYIMTLIFLFNLSIYVAILLPINNKVLFIFVQSILCFLNIYFYSLVIGPLNIVNALVFVVFFIIMLNLFYLLNNLKYPLVFSILFVLISFLSLYSNEKSDPISLNHDVLVSQNKKAGKNIYFIGIDGLISKNMYTKYFNETYPILKDLDSLNFFVKDVRSPGTNTLETYAKLVTYKNYIHPRTYKIEFSNRFSAFYIDAASLGYKKQFVFPDAYFGVDQNNIFDHFYPKNETYFNFCSTIDKRWGWGFCRYYNAIFKKQADLRKDIFSFYTGNVELVFNNKEKWFSIQHIIFPKHSPLSYNSLDQEEYVNFINYYTSSMSELKEILKRITNYITTKDKEPIIVFMGDHGSWLFRNAKPGDYVNHHQVTADEIDQDKKDVLLAIYPYEFGKSLALLVEKNGNRTNLLFRYILQTLQ
jgi:hypothetical protein